MNVIESQANKKQCPARVWCNGADCMAWRWLDPVQRRSIKANVVGFPVDKEPTWQRKELGVPDSYEFCPEDLDPACWVEPREEAEARRRGYCGLAGLPGQFALMIKA